MVPAFVGGTAGGVADGSVVAVAVHGRIEATTKLLPRNGRLEYAAIVRPSSLRPGKNRVTVLAAGPTDLQVLTTVNWAGELRGRLANRERARGIEPPFQAWEARVLTIGQRPRGNGRIPARH